LFKFFSLMLFLLLSFSTYSAENVAMSHLSLTVESNKQKSISVIIPFPPGRLPVKSIFLLFDGENIIESKAQSHLLWPSATASSERFIRALSLDFKSAKNGSNNLKLLWRNSYFVLPTGKPKNTIVSAFFSNNWLAKSSYFPMLSENKEFKLAWYQWAANNFGEYITDNALLKKYSKNGLDFTKPSPWLYDHPNSLYNLYFRTGDIKWKKKGHESASKFRSLINDKGYFSLKKNADLKYLIPSGLLVDYLFHPNEKTLNVVSKMYKNSLYWPTSYDETIGFWTERHLANAMSLALVMWELTNDTEYKKRLDSLIAGTLERIFSLPYQKGGCVKHYYKAHEGGKDETLVCSPWMNALVVEQLWRYVAISNDDKAKKVIGLLAGQVLDGGYYKGWGVHMKNYIVPHYLTFYGKSQNQEVDQWTDMQHACDVASMIAKAAYLRKLEGEDVTEHVTIMTSLLRTCKKTISRSSAVKVWEISPLRKFNWLFSSTASLEWLNEQLVTSK
jgi:hypothetical protein